MGVIPNLSLLLFSSLLVSWVLTFPQPNLHPRETKSKPQRIVSANLRSDEVLLALVERERLIAVSYLSLDPSLSNVTEAAKTIPHKVKVDPEMIYALAPDLVVAGEGSSPDALGQLIRLGIKVFKTQRFDSIEDIRDAILELGKAVGEEKKAEALVASVDERLQRVRETARKAGRRPLVLYYSTGGYTGGRKTIVNDLILAAGGRNLAAEKGISGYKKFSLEALVMDQPEVILLGERSDKEKLLYQDLSSHPGLKQVKAVKEMRLYSIPSRYLVTSSHYVVEGVERVAPLLHPKLFPERAVGLSQ